MEPRAALIKGSFDLVHYLYSAVVQDYSDESAAYAIPGGMVPTPLAILAHALFSEDMMVAEVAQEPLVLNSEGFGEKTGIRQPDPRMSPDWHASAFSLDGLREYADAVFARTNSFLERATAADLDREFTSPIGQPTNAAAFLASFGVVHFSEHIGELSALKGAQGIKGLPF